MPPCTLTATGHFYFHAERLIVFKMYTDKLHFKQISLPGISSVLALHHHLYLSLLSNFPNLMFLIFRVSLYLKPDRLIE